MNNSFVMNLF